ncbi:MAG: hypothetical protein MJ249_08365, partial [Kiritimatiellae bacterium]|nr:hypothetical protein [Kiritimatiellia bacterium]
PPSALRPKFIWIREDCQWWIRREIFKLPSVSREAGFRVFSGEKSDLYRAIHNGDSALAASAGFWHETF